MSKKALKKQQKEAQKAAKKADRNAQSVSCSVINIYYEKLNCLFF